MRTTVTILKWILIGAASLAALISIVAYVIQSRLIFSPTKLPQSHVFRFDLPFREEYFAMEDGAIINALHFSVRSPLRIVLYFHGNTGSLDSWGGVAGDFVQHGYEVVVIDYRGFGKSTGSISEHALQSDGMAIYDRLTESYSESDIVVYGRSIGSAPATFVAAHRDPKALILESPFYSMRDLVRHMFPVVPAFLLRYPLRNDIYLARVTSPILLFHGTDDRVIYYDSSTKLKRLVPAARLISIDGGRHNDLPDNQIYKTELRHILSFVR